VADLICERLKALHNDVRNTPKGSRDCPGTFQADRNIRLAETTLQVRPRGAGVHTALDVGHLRDEVLHGHVLTGDQRRSFASRSFNERDSVLVPAGA